MKIRRFPLLPALLVAALVLAGCTASTQDEIDALPVAELPAAPSGWIDESLEAFRFATDPEWEIGESRGDDADWVERMWTTGLTDATGSVEPAPYPMRATFSRYTGDEPESLLENDAERPVIERVEIPGAAQAVLLADPAFELEADEGRTYRFSVATVRMLTDDGDLYVATLEFDGDDPELTSIREVVAAFALD